MNKVEFITKLAQKSEQLRIKGSNSRLAIEMHTNRHSYSIEVRHYINNGCQKWVILTEQCLDNKENVEKILKYIEKVE